jgi:hypothetical protein
MSVDSIIFSGLAYVRLDCFHCPVLFVLLNLEIYIVLATRGLWAFAGVHQ